MNVKLDESQRLKSYNDFLKKLGQLFQIVHIALKLLRFIKFDINQTCSPLKSMMQYCRTIFGISVVFNVENDV